MAEICQGLNSLGFEVGESDIIASTKEVAQTLHYRIKEEGFAIRIQGEVKDLGVGTTLGRTKPWVIKQNRYRKASNRINRIAQIAKIQRKASALYTTGAWPMKYHGHVAIGLSQSELAKARRDMVRCSGAP